VWSRTWAPPGHLAELLAKGDALTVGTFDHAYLIDAVFSTGGAWYVRLYNP
jgi:hypothetical protein